MSSNNGRQPHHARHSVVAGRPERRSQRGIKSKTHSSTLYFAEKIFHLFTKHDFLKVYFKTISVNRALGTK